MQDRAVEARLVRHLGITVQRVAIAQLSIDQGRLGECGVITERFGRHLGQRMRRGRPSVIPTTPAVTPGKRDAA
ncbi:hypothetical protein X756_24135 [Mesorhizobium sp. LSHC412B00]|nr:hypothetical protein X756_24135 [Mesorhizobium sp. LSHC412B00]